ncbi:serine/threonine/tyrosine-interacting protein-like isoform X2 [Leptotrombidium deliense]|uniref:Serine/threonine/tyrosine-interacting protein-like isoform X2 n=1 Tax=Leptotrombidium deliense TaxID=299467 RepID=A0A443SDT9_9ACAR|nr:serine/threonine/tyrosine-interacting protein-like isoform X2 [Leptotrombidium deliense]
METDVRPVDFPISADDLRPGFGIPLVSTDTQFLLNIVLQQEWEYQMRREMQEIIPGLFLGPYAAAMKTKQEDLIKHGITHILCVRQNCESNVIKTNFPGVFEYKIVEIADSPTEKIIPVFDEAREFIGNCLRKGGKVLVHGNAGISRSAALVIAYVMEHCNFSSQDALRCVQKKRFCIYPNEGFRRQLLEYEPILKARLAQRLTGVYN